MSQEIVLFHDAPNHAGAGASDGVSMRLLVGEKHLSGLSPSSLDLVPPRAPPYGEGSHAGQSKLPAVAEGFLPAASTYSEGSPELQPKRPGEVRGKREPAEAVVVGPDACTINIPDEDVLLSGTIYNFAEAPGRIGPPTTMEHGRHLLSRLYKHRPTPRQEQSGGVGPNKRQRKTSWAPSLQDSSQRNQRQDAFGYFKR